MANDLCDMVSAPKSDRYQLLAFIINENLLVGMLQVQL